MKEKCYECQERNHFAKNTLYGNYKIDIDIGSGVNEVQRSGDPALRPGWYRASLNNK